MENDIERWKDVRGFEGEYQISNLGNIKSLSREVINRKGWSPYVTKERILKPAPTSCGYLAVTFYYKDRKEKRKKTITIHQLVAEAFLGHIRCGYKLVINHINHNILDNRVKNLEIVTQRENANKKHIKSSSKYTGVTLDKVTKKWKSFIIFNKKIKHLGYFNTEIEASEYYENALKCVLENRPQDIVCKKREKIKNSKSVTKIKNGKYCAKLTTEGYCHYLGLYDNEIDAHNAILKKIEQRNKLYGKH